MRVILPISAYPLLWNQILSFVWRVRGGGGEKKKLFNHLLLKSTLFHPPKYVCVS